jgi:hypothetical protein
MHAPLSRRILRLIIPLALLSLQAPESRAAESPSEVAPLVVANGRFQRDGKSTAATVRNLIDFVQQRYPNANITIVGADDIVIEQLTLQWRDRLSRDDNGVTRPMPPPLRSVLTALAEASGRRFEVQEFGNLDYVLRGWRADAARAATRIFNLRALMAPSAKARDLEDELQMVQTQLRGMLPRVSIGAMSKDDLVPLENRVAIIKRRLDEIPKPEVELDRLLAQIREVVELTLKLSHPGEGVPDFKYHPGSGLLIAVGSETAVDTTRMVIEALGKKG